MRHSLEMVDIDSRHDFMVYCAHPARLLRRTRLHCPFVGIALVKFSQCSSCADKQ